MVEGQAAAPAGHVKESRSARKVAAGSTGGPVRNMRRSRTDLGSSAGIAAVVISVFLCESVFRLQCLAKTRAA